MKKIISLISGVLLFTGCEKIPELDSPKLISPLNGEQIVQPVFVWSSEGDSYEFQFSIDSTFTSIDYFKTGLVDTTLTPTDPLDPGTYYWRVRASKESWSYWSAVRKFIVVPPTWDIELLSPLDADTVKMPVLIWSSSGYTQKYHLYVYQGQPEAGNLVISKELSDTSYTLVDSMKPATYYWKVDADGKLSDYRRVVTYSLDETYFPVGPGYVWEYQDSYYSAGCFGDSCDTSFYTIKVESFISQGDSLLVALSGPNYFTGKTYVYKNDSVYFFCVDQRLTSISLIPHDGEPMYDHEADQPRPDLWADKNTDSTFGWGWGWLDSNLPYRLGSRHEYWQKGKGMYLFDEGEDWHPNDPGQDPAVGRWSHRKLLVKLNTGQ